MILKVFKGFFYFVGFNFKSSQVYNLDIMNKFDIDIFDEVLNIIKSLYVVKVKELNDKEFYFRIVLRKSFYFD